MYSEKTAGFYRANEAAASPNNLRLMDAETPGTPGQDNGTIPISATSIASGFEYIKNGVSEFVPFTDYQFPDGKNETTVVPIGSAAALTNLRDHLREALERFEVDPVLSVTVSGGNFVIRHVGSGTVDYILVNGAAVQLTRTVLP